MDDETLGCGALIARLAAIREIHVVFATDGSRSPELPGGPAAAAVGLAATREAEGTAALGVLGVPPERLHFLRFPDGSLRQCARPFRAALLAKLAELGEAELLVPFRYDWHPDHVAVHRVAAAALGAGELRGRLTEYFVYTRRRLLPKGDVRAYVRPAWLIRVAAEGEADRKFRALQCFRSQTTLHLAGQRRPILQPELLRRMCSEPESFLRCGPAAPQRVFRGAAWLRLATALEPRLKRAKDGVRAWLPR